MDKYVVETKVISNSNIGDNVFIPTLSLIPSDTRLSFPFLFVFPYCQSSIIGYNNFIIKSMNDLKILIMNDKRDNINVASNVVYREVFRNVYK